MEIKSKHIYLLLLVLIAFFSACKKANNVDNASKPVVIGLLIPGQPLSVRVYQQKGLSDTSTYGAGITGLKLSVKADDQTVQLTEVGEGIYTYPDTTFIKTGKNYQLSFNYAGILISANTTIPAKPTGYTTSKTLINLPGGSISDPTATDSIAVTLRWDNPDSLYHVIVFKNDDSSPYNIHPQMNSAVNFTINAKKADHYDVYQRTFNYIGIYRAILWNVNKDYIDALSTNANTTSQKLADPPTNITNGYGLFTGMQSDTIKLQLTQY